MFFQATMPAFTINIIFFWLLINLSTSADDDLPSLLDPEEDDYIWVVDESAPTLSPIINLTQSPTNVPSANPTRTPTKKPTRNPTTKPTKHPSMSPTNSPTESPTEVWDSKSSQKQSAKGKAKGNTKKSKKSSMNSHQSVSDEELLRNAMSAKQQHIQSTTAIKLYHLHGTFNDDAMTAFQTELIAQQQDDFTMIAKMVNIDPKINKALQRLPDGTTRVICYHGVAEMLFSVLNRFSDIMKMIRNNSEINKFQNNSIIFEGNKANIINQQIALWVETVIEVCRKCAVFKMTSLFNVAMKNLENDPEVKGKMTHTQELLLTTMHGLYANGSHKKLKLSGKVTEDVVFLMLQFYKHMAIVWWTCFTAETEKLMAESNWLPRDTYHNHTQLIKYSWLDQIADFMKVNVDIKTHFDVATSQLVPYIIGERLYYWKYASDEHDHRSVHIMLVNADLGMIRSFIQFLNESYGKKLRVEEYSVSIKSRQRGKYKFVKSLLARQ